MRTVFKIEEEFLEKFFGLLSSWSEKLQYAWYWSALPYHQPFIILTSFSLFITLFLFLILQVCKHLSEEFEFKFPSAFAVYFKLPEDEAIKYLKLFLQGWFCLLAQLSFSQLVQENFSETQIFSEEILLSDRSREYWVEGRPR